MDLCFSKRELSWLDDLMPESKKKKLDDAKKKAKEEEVEPCISGPEEGGREGPVWGSVSGS